MIRRSWLVTAVLAVSVGWLWPTAAVAETSPASPVQHLVVVTLESVPSAPVTTSAPFAARGMRLDAWSEARFTPAFVQRLTAAGLDWRVYVAPQGRASHPRAWIAPLGRYSDDAAVSAHVFDLQRYYADAARNALPALSLLVGPGASSPAAASGQVARTTVNALIASPGWVSSAAVLQYGSTAGRSREGLVAPALVVSSYVRPGAVRAGPVGADALATWVLRNWRLVPPSTPDDLDSTFDFAQPAASTALIAAPDSPTRVHQPRSTTLYAGYALAVAIGLAVTAWAVASEWRRRPVLHAVPDPPPTRPGMLAMAVVAVVLGAALSFPRWRWRRVRFRRSGFPRPRRPSLAALGLVVVLGAVVGLPLTAAHAEGDEVLHIQTVPAAAGVELLVGSAHVRTDRQGAAELHDAAASDARSAVRLVRGVAGDGSTIVISKLARRALPDGATLLQVGLDVSSKVLVRIAPGASGADPSAVRSVRLHAVTGQVLTVDPQRAVPVTLLARRTRLAHGSLSTQRVTWSVERVLAGEGVALSTTTSRFDPLGHSLWTLTLQAVRGTLEIDTVPVTPGATFLVDGGTVTTDSRGHAAAPVADLNDVDSRLRLAEPAAADRMLSLAEVHRVRSRVTGTRHVEAVLTVRRAVTVSFRDAAGRPFDSGRVSELVLRAGGTTTTHAGADLNEPLDLLTSTVSREHGRWVARPVLYSVVSASVDGSNAVFAGKQRFAPGSANSWPVMLAAFDLEVTVHDLLLGSRVATRAVIRRPDTSTQDVQLGSGSATVLPALARGLYDITLDAAVVGGSTTVLVSRDDAVDLRVLTRTDAVLLGTGGIGLATGLVVLGSALARRGRRLGPG